MVIPVETYVAFVAATALLVLTPGPMVAYVVGASMTRGPVHGLAAVAGSTFAGAIQLGAVAIGLSTLMAEASAAFFWIKWIGVAYLVFLGIQALRKPIDEDALKPNVEARPLKQTVAEAFLVNMTNPKALLFHGAFLPLFLNPAAPAGPQLAVLAATFLVVAGVLDCGWAFFAGRLAPVMQKAGRWGTRVTGGVFLAAAAGLALARK